MQRNSLTHKQFYVSLLVVAIACNGLVAQRSQRQRRVTMPTTAKRLTERQKVNHLLNRIAFGARPGDVERVTKLGWQKYLDQQLHPETIADAILEEKLNAFPELQLTNEQLVRAFPPLNLMNRYLQQRGIDQRMFGEMYSQVRSDRPFDAKATAANQNLAISSYGKATPEEVEKRRNEILAVIKELNVRPTNEVFTMAQQAKVLRAVYSERQLQEVLTDFWFNHFNVFARKGGPSNTTLIPYERDTIRPNVFGKFEDLLRATAQSAAMLYYLDNFQSMSPTGRRPPNLNSADLFVDPTLRPPMPNNPPRPNRPPQNPPPRRPGAGINENYAREIMELHTLGVDGGYTQQDVQEVARCFTGWTLKNPQLGGGFHFEPLMHDNTEKTVLGQKIPAGGGINDGEAVIKILAHQPSTAKFIATKLARKFVSDNPSSALIDRVAKVYLKTDGDLREVYRALFASPEFWAVENYRAKIKTPFEMIVSTVRATGAETDGGRPMLQTLEQMGEGLYLAQPPTGYPETAEHWVNTGALLLRMNFALSLSNNRIRGTKVNVVALLADSKSDTPELIADQMIKTLLNGEMSSQTRATLATAISEPHLMNVTNLANNPLLPRIVALVLGSPEFQRQ
ncbi:MAG: DUF1800 domain-containing protein [Acidobacteria bacterium]|nr:DUF1800 domain-containing protein [Acidobacteriota bacterium]